MGQATASVLPGMGSLFKNALNTCNSVKQSLLERGYMMWKVERVLFQPKLVFAVFGRLDGHGEVHSNLSDAIAASDKLLHQPRISTRKGVR